MSGSAYEVFTKISMINNVSGVLAVVAKDVLALEGGVNRLQKAFSEINRVSLAVGGGLALFGGTAALAGLNKMVEHGEKLVHVKQQLIAADVKGAELAEATAKAWETASRYGMSVTGVLNDIKELRTTFGSTKAAMQFLDPLEQMRIVLNTVTEGKGDAARSAVYEMGRAGELKGLQKPEDFVSYFNSMTKAISASGGLVDPKAFVQATQYGRLATKGWDEAFYTQYLPSLIQEMKPSGAGTALMSLFGTIAQGKASKRATEAMIDAGLITDPSKIVYNKVGPAGFRYGAVEQSDLFVLNPAVWARDVLGPILEKKFGELSVDNPKLIGGLGDMFGNRMSAQAIASLVAESRRIEKDAGQARQARGLDFAGQAMAHDPTIAMGRFKTAWDNLLTAFSEPLVQPKIDIMNKLSGAMNKLAEWATKNPASVEMLGKGLVGLAVGLTALGATAIVASLALLAGPAGLIAGFASAMAAVIALNWNSLNPNLRDFFTGMSRLVGIGWDVLKVGLDGFVKVLGIIPGVIVDVAKSIMSALGWVKSAIGGFFSKTGFDGGGMGGGGIVNASYGGAAGGGGGGGGSIVSLGHKLQAMGYRVSEHPSFGGVHPVHHGRGHYEGRAIDVNIGNGVFEAGNPAAAAKFDALASSLRGQGYKVIWRAPGHYNHMHVEAPRGGRVNFSPPVKRSTGGGGGDVVLKVDGRELGRVASHQIARVHEHSRQAPYFNGRGMFAGPDTQFAVG
ncbi:hypothetical protein LG047_15330 [Methylocystis sp. WRRC1]|uniref:hypothetical protein n=1 Tax=Methylocystis sp. WRRC1 TaxID=1732014 RepID=UPI001D14341C|nr:hypothetical protein [Methylocystis sp. WRRC1]MCC3246672.1 hypothetical protein [Methylocystis sp. WRRC1]